MRVLALGAAIFVVACGGQATDRAVSGDDPLHLGSTKHTATFGQRDTQTVPNTIGRLSIVLGDVEGTDLVESVQLIDHKDEQTVLDKTSLRVGSKTSFEIDGTQYELELIATDSSHILHDTATFKFSRTSD